MSRRGLLQDLPDRLVRDRIHDLQLDQPLGQQPQRPPLAALGWGAARQDDQVGLLLPIQPAAVLALRRLAVHGGPQLPGGVLLTHPGHGGVVNLQRGGDRPVGPARAGLALVGLEQDAGVGPGRSQADQGVGPGTLLLG
jgi:hypothetical protein